MFPVLFKIGPFCIYSYGFMVAVGFSVVTLLVYRRAAIFGIDKDKMVDYMILILVSGIIGARIMYVIINAGYYINNPIEIFYLSRGGLVWYGGLAAAFIASVWFVKRKGMDLWSVADLMAPYLALGQAFGRVGCYLNGCCFGIYAPVGCIFGDRHPTQIYSAILLLVIFGLLLRLQERRRFTSEIFLAYCMFYSLKRFVIEFLRGDNPKILLGMTISQVISVIIFIAALVMYKKKAKNWKLKALHGTK